MCDVSKVWVIVLNNRYYNIDQNNNDYCHNQEAFKVQMHLSFKMNGRWHSPKHTHD